MIIIDAELRAAVKSVCLESWIKRRAATAIAIVLLERIRTAESDDQYTWSNFNYQGSDRIVISINCAISILFNIYQLHYLRPKGISNHFQEIDFFAELDQKYRKT